MEVKIWDYRSFPEYMDEIEGVEVIDTSGDERGAHYYKDIEYAVMSGTPLHLQILIPTSRNQPRSARFPLPPELKDIPLPPSTACKPETLLPCVIYVQGSAWMKQDCYANIPQIAELVKRGFVVAVVEYRHSGIAPFPAQCIDARNAIRYMRKNADMFYVNPDAMILMGDSSGGHTAVFGGLRHNDDTDENLFPGISGEVCGIIDEYGSVSVMLEDGNPSTLAHHLPESPEGRAMGFVNLRERPDLCRTFSAECNIDESTEIAPMLILHGTKDRTVNTKQSVNLYNRLKKCGKDATLCLIKGADHGGAEFWSEDVLDIIENFIKKCIEK